MKLKITFSTPQQAIPFAYQHYIQGAIYSSLNSDTATYLHDEGDWSDNRNYKMFTFSQLLGHYRIKNGMIQFDSQVTLYITSLYAEVLNEIYFYLERQGYMQIGKVKFVIEELEAIKEVDVNPTLSSYTIKTLSPALVYTTDEKKFTTYHDPHSQVYEDIVRNNLFNKYKALYGERPEEEDFKITDVIYSKPSIYKYKGNTFKGYNLTLKIEATHDILLIALHTGIGSKNSGGFGMIGLAY